MLLRTLGGLELVNHPASGVDAKPSTPLLGPAKPLALLTYLALSPERRSERDTLIEMLWARADPERARGTLRQTVWALRQKFGDQALLTEREAVVLALPLDVDAAQFEHAVAAGDVRRACSLYTGPFLKDITIAGAPGFSHWADRQRARYEALYLTAGEQLARQQLRDLNTAEGCATLRTLLRTAPDRLDLWTLLIESLLTAGDRVAAQLESERLRAVAQDEELTLTAELRALMQRLRKRSTAADRDALNNTEPPTVQPSLIGRDQSLSALFDRWNHVVNGHGGVLHAIGGSAGMGKSRLLAEFRDRLTDLGATVIALRPRPAERDMPYALAATLAEALAELPGAAGVSPASAAVLVDLAPSLSNVYPYAGRTSATPEELLRRRTLAITELVQMVTEEAPIALLVDDLHWTDSSSRQLLASLSERLTEAAAAPPRGKALGTIRHSTMGVMLVVCYRPVRGGWVLPPEASVSELGPLAEVQLVELLASLAPEPRDLVETLGQILFESTGGVPLLALAALELAIEQQWVGRAGTTWTCSNVALLREELSRGGVLERLLQELPSDGMAVLVALALIRRPLDTSHIAAVVRTDGVEALLRSLERRGLVIQAGSTWDTAHDRQADAALTIAPIDLQRSVAFTLARSLTRDANTDPRVTLLAGRMLASVQHPDAPRYFVRWLRATRRRRFWRDPLTAAAAFLGRGASLPDLQTLASVVTRAQRARYGYPELSVAAALALFTLVGALTVVSSARFFEPPATRLVLAPIPSERGFLWDDQPIAPDLPRESWPKTRAIVPIAISFRDNADHVTRNTPKRVVVRLEQISGAATLGSDSVLQVREGRTFPDSVVVHGVGGFRLRLEADGLPSTVTPTLYSARTLRRLDELSHLGRLRLVAGSVNGVPVDSVQRVVAVRPGQPIDGALQLHTITDVRAAAILLGAVPLWGDRVSNYLVLGALPAFGDYTEQVQLRDRLTGRQLRAPMKPGRYPLLLIWHPETEMRYIASGTNWMLGTPQWNDGNDLQDLGPAELADIESQGYFWWRLLKPTDEPGRPAAIFPTVLNATALYFEVQ